MKKTYLIICLIAVLIVGTSIVYGQLHSDEKTSLLSGYSISVHKTPTCGCCGEYVKYLKEQGANVTVVEHENLTEARRSHHIPSILESCHFSVIEGYVIEGHVPTEAIIKLLEERPDISGIALPGMPAGSPGMGGTKLAPFVIHQFAPEDGDMGIYVTL